MKSIGLGLLLFVFYAQGVVAQLTYDEFLEVKTAVYRGYQDLDVPKSERLRINQTLETMDPQFWWKSDYVHASYVRVEDPESETLFHNIYLIGGYVRLKNMTKDGLAITACHEIGHGVAKGPRKKSSQLSPVGSAVEAESDYYATNVCAPVVFKYLKPSKKKIVTRRIVDLCRRQTKRVVSKCERLMMALNSTIYYFQYEGQLASLDKHSDLIATEINHEAWFKPEAQCRLDTLVNGIMGLKRPECWYPGGEKNHTLKH